jgi:hypothetical protein
MQRLSWYLKKKRDKNHYYQNKVLKTYCKKYYNLLRQKNATVENTLYCWEQKRQIQDNLYCFGVSESEYDNQIALSRTKVKVQGIK